jgi:hypothetical protein
MISAVCATNACSTHRHSLPESDGCAIDNATLRTLPRLPNLHRNERVRLLWGKLQPDKRHVCCVSYTR